MSIKHRRQSLRPLSSVLRSTQPKRAAQPQPNDASSIQSSLACLAVALAKAGQSKAYGVKSKNPCFQNFFISFHISIYNFISFRNSRIFRPNAHVRPIMGTPKLCPRSFDKLITNTNHGSRLSADLSAEASAKAGVLFFLCGFK